MHIDNSIPVIRERSGRPEQRGMCRDDPPKQAGSGKHRPGQAVWCGLTAARAGRDNDTSAEMQLSVDRIEPTGYEALTRGARMIPSTFMCRGWGGEDKYSLIFTSDEIFHVTLNSDAYEIDVTG